MKKILLVFAMIILIVLLFLPFALRILLPDLEEQQQEVASLKYLVCNNQNYTIRTNYDNNKVKMIVIRKNYLNTNDDNSQPIDEDLTNTQPENLTNPTLDKIFETLKNDSAVVYNQIEEGETILLDLSVSTYPNLNLSNITQSPTNQKSFYEQSGLNCIIRE